MIFGLFRNKQGEAMHEEAIRTLNKANELPKKNKKWIAKHLLERIILYVGELEDLKIPSPQADRVLKSHVNEATFWRQKAVGPLEDNDPQWLLAAMLESFAHANTGAFGKKESLKTVISIRNWIEENAPTEFSKNKKKLERYERG